MYKYQDYDSVCFTTTLFKPGNIDPRLNNSTIVITDWLTKHISNSMLQEEK